MRIKEINGVPYEVYTDKDWCKDGDLCVKVGQLIENRVYLQLRSGLTPKQDNKVFQPGEPYSHDKITGRPLYRTFVKVADFYYKYIGLSD